MHIVQISKASRSGGGASRVAEMLHEGLIRKGLRSTHMARHPGSSSDAPVRLAWPTPPLRCCERALQVLSKMAGLPYAIPTEFPTLRRLAARNPTLFHFHDLSNAISPLTLQMLSRHAPVVWTLHDCSPITGGCLYPMACTRYLQSCGHCPQRGVWPLNTLRDGTRQMRALQWWVHRHASIHYVSPSRWLASLVQSSGAVTDVSVIPNGVDVQCFRPVLDRQELRARLGIPAGRPVVLVGAAALTEPRKGAKSAMEVLKKLQADVHPFVMLLGKTDAKLLESFHPLQFKTFGYVGSPTHLRELYAAADAYLNCTLADNFPLSILESLACGTPVFGFRTGGIPEIVEDGYCGALVGQTAVDELAAMLRQYLLGRIGHHWREQACTHARENFSAERQIDAHLELYRLIEPRPAC